MLPLPLPLLFSYETSARVWNLTRVSKPTVLTRNNHLGTDKKRYNIPEQCRLDMTEHDIKTGKELLQVIYPSLFNVSAQEHEMDTTNSNHDPFERVRKK